MTDEDLADLARSGKPFSVRLKPILFEMIGFTGENAEEVISWVEDRGGNAELSTRVDNKVDVTEWIETFIRIDRSNDWLGNGDGFDVVKGLFVEFDVDREQFSAVDYLEILNHREILAVDEVTAD